MNYNQYKELAARTLKQRDDYEKDITHMLMGATGEILEELSEAMANKDIVNIVEEYGDIAWYIAGLAVIENVDLEVQSVSKMHWTQCVGALNSLYKKMFVYNKLVDRQEIHKLIARAFFSLDLDWSNNIAKSQLPVMDFYGVTYDQGISFVNVLEININKLKIRYPEKYSDELAGERLDK